MSTETVRLRNGQTIRLDDLAVLDENAFVGALHDLLVRGMRVCAYFGDRQDDGDVRLYAVCADDRNGALHLATGLVRSGGFVSLTPHYPQVHLFEREIHEQTGLVPRDHPWLKPVRYPQQSQAERVDAPAIGEADFFLMQGEEVHEVAVGPVHAGIIEPGHFRFQCHGETVYHLEIALGYQHRGIEGALRGGPHHVTPFQMETIAGDSTIGHMTAYCQLIEALSAKHVPPYAHLVRAIALELERCANHIGDLGALAGDVGFLPTLSYCGRIRGDFLNMTAVLCGNRFGRSLVVPGGIGHLVDQKRAEDLAARVARGMEDFLSATELLWTEASVGARFEGTGAVSLATAEQIGLVGPAARACGWNCDVRQDHPHGQYRFAHIPVSTHDTGDVFGRAYVRWREVRASSEFLSQQIPAIGSLATPKVPSIAERNAANLAFNAVGVSLVEGWRGEICHVAVTDAEGRFRRYKVVDPSFHNWFGLALALRNQQISDFPLCNKSFNLSYCGFDL